MSQEQEQDQGQQYSHEPKVCLCCPTPGGKVGTRGNWQSPIVLVGEGADATGLKSGLPFMGPAAKLIVQSWPKDLGLDIEDCFYTTAAQCFISSKDPVRQQKAIYCCHDRLFEQIGAAPRKIILAFGKWAGISLLRDDNFKIMTQRGVVSTIRHPGREGETCKIIHIMHPAQLLRGQGNLKQFQQDLRRAVEFALDMESRVYIDPDYNELSSAERIQELIDYIKEINATTGKPVRIGTDIETTGFSWWKNRILCIGFFIHGSDKQSDNIGYIVDWDRILLEWKNAGVNIEGLNQAECIRGKQLSEEDKAKSPMYMKLKELLELAPEIAAYIWQNGKFDMKFLRTDGIATRIDEDTYAASYSLDERAGSHGLEEIAKNHLNAPDYKDEIKTYLPKKDASYIHIPKPILWKYLARDVKNTHDAFNILIEKVHSDANDTKNYEKCLKPYMRMLTNVEMNGFYVDTGHVRENDVWLTREIEEAQARVSEAAGEYLNPNSHAQVSAYLYGKLDLRLKGKTPDGTAKEILDKLYEETKHPVLKAIRDYRTVVKARSTYIKAVYTHIAADGRIHSTYDPCRTTTGRLGSSEPNLQNIPRNPKIRRMYRSSMDFDHPRILVEGDYNTAELRALGALSSDPVLIAIFADPSRSLHDEVATEMYGPGFNGDQRIRAKAINFGIPYGREAFSIAEEFDITVEEAQRLINRWFATFPTAAEFLRKCREAPTNGQTLITAFGRKRRPGVVSPELLHGLKNEFSNFFMQSTINDFTLQSACEMEYELRKLDSFIVNLIHDAVLIDAPRQAYFEVKKVMQTYMESVPKKWITTPVTFKADIKAGTHWGELIKEEKFHV